MTPKATPTLAALALVSACGPLLGVESVSFEEEPLDAGATPPAVVVEAGVDTGADAAESCAAGTTRACNAHPEDGVGPCKAGSQTCEASGTWGPCGGDVGPTAEACDAVDRNCNGVPGVDERAPAPPPGTMDCTKIFACAAPGRGPLYYRTGIGFTNAAGANTEWTAFAPRGDFSDGTNPPGTFRISRDATGTKLGPVSVPSACCPGTGCPTMNVLFDGQGQYYTLP